VAADSSWRNLAEMDLHFARSRRRAAARRREPAPRPNTRWRTLRSDEGAQFERECVLDCSALEPQITWGTDPSQVLGISERASGS